MLYRVRKLLRRSRSFKKRSRKMLQILGVLPLALMLLAEHRLIGQRLAMRAMNCPILVDSRLLLADQALPLLSLNLLLLALRLLHLERL